MSNSASSSNKLNENRSFPERVPRRNIFEMDDNDLHLISVAECQPVIDVMVLASRSEKVVSPPFLRHETHRTRKERQRIWYSQAVFKLVLDYTDPLLETRQHGFQDWVTGLGENVRYVHTFLIDLRSRTGLNSLRYEIDLAKDPDTEEVFRCVRSEGGGADFYEAMLMEFLRVKILEPGLPAKFQRGELEVGDLMDLCKPFAI